MQGAFRAGQDCRDVVRNRRGVQSNALGCIEARLATLDLVEGHMNFFCTALVLSKSIMGMKQNTMLVGVY